MSLPLTIYLGLLFVCCSYAVARGGAPERIGVGILLVGIVASNLMPKYAPWHYVHIEIGILLVDLAMLGAVLALAFRAQRYWPIWWTGLKLCSVIIHLMMLAPLMMPWSYSIASASLSFATPALLAAAAYRHRQRLALYGSDPPWSEPAHWRNSDDGASLPSSSELG